MDDVQRALTGLFGMEDDQRSESALRLRNKKGSDSEESAALDAACLEEGEYEAAVRHFRTAIEQR